MAKRSVILVYPQELIQQPVLFRMAKQFNVIPNIRRARVTETAGEIEVELEGTEENIQAGLNYLSDRGITIELAAGDVVKPRV